MRLVCVTPSHQFATGAQLPASRRLALLDWACWQSAYVLKDDYDGEFRYAARPLESLQGRDPQQRVLYVGAFSNGVSPAATRLRSFILGYATLREPQIEQGVARLARALRALVRESRLIARA